MADNIEIITVKRPHSFVAKRGDNIADHICRYCGKRRAQIASSVCFEEEVEREVIDQDGNS